MIVVNNIISLEADLEDLKNYLPLNMKNSYFQIMFENLLIVEESNFYNSAVINLTHFYNYILHCFLVQIYHLEENRELLKYLQKTTNVLNSRDNNRRINLEESFDTKSFSNIEKDSINYFFHILNLCENSHLCQKNQAIFDLRNSAAHLNMDIINRSRFDDFVDKIQYNLKELLNKTYKTTKELIIKELRENIKSELLSDDSDRLAIFEEINSTYCISQNFYKLFLKYNKFENVQPNTPLYYIKNFIEKDLGMEREN